MFNWSQEIRLIILLVPGFVVSSPLSNIFQKEATDEGQAQNQYQVQELEPSWESDVRTEGYLHSTYHYNKYDVQLLDNSGNTISINATTTPKLHLYGASGFKKLSLGSGAAANLTTDMTESGSRIFLVPTRIRYKRARSSSSSSSSRSSASSASSASSRSSASSASSRSSASSASSESSRLSALSSSSSLSSLSSVAASKSSAQQLEMMTTISPITTGLDYNTTYRLFNKTEPVSI